MTIPLRRKPLFKVKRNLRIGATGLAGRPPQYTPEDFSTRADGQFGRTTRWTVAGRATPPCKNETPRAIGMFGRTA